FEQYLLEAIDGACEAGARIEIRGANRVIGLSALDPAKTADAPFRLNVETPEGRYDLDVDWVIAADGARSPLRAMLGLGFDGRVFEDNFLIADIRMQKAAPTERRFWFDPPFNRGETALMHKQPDDIWRLDFQLGWDIDRAAELDPGKIKARVAAMIGADTPFELVWSSIYTFRCCTMEAYRHGRIFFAGDSAHQVSPFGARGANGGVQDVDNLGWKLGAVLRGEASDALLDSYHSERKQAADENIRASSRSADFLTPRTAAHALFRDAVLDLVEDFEFARPMVNSGRLSTPCTYDGSPLNGVDALPDGPVRTRPGSPCCDVILQDGHLLERLPKGASLLAIGLDLPDRISLGTTPLPVLALSAAEDTEGLLAQRYLGASASALYLLRPDQHVAARWARFDQTALATAYDTMMGGGRDG
ncbi:MAG: FAD-dependent monooxygenase, partial [Pseudomonadota bacterium]